VDAFVDFFDPLPIAVLFAVFIAAGLLFTFGLEAVVHRRVPSETRERVSNSTAVMIQVLAVFYAVLVAFVIVSERGAITEANDHVAEEAAAMSALYQDVGGFPPADRERIRAAILAYNRSVLEHDFHAVESTGEPSAETTRRLDDLYAAVQSAEPAVGTGAFYSQAVNDLSDITRARRNRNADAGDTIPGPLFFLVAIISVFVLAVATLLNTRERGTHVALLAVLAIVTALNLALIIALEHPFSGAIAVSDQPLRVGVLAPAVR
jgi:protein-S-isoprenylcysteine O-methyltransferase Ste14